jgi:hypothetical protein
MSYELKINNAFPKVNKRLYSQQGEREISKLKRSLESLLVFLSEYIVSSIP